MTKAPASPHFTAVELSALFNVNRDSLPDSLSFRGPAEWAFGAQSLRGMPFALGHAKRANVICLDQAPVIVPLGDVTASFLKSLYGKRWGIECGFRDTKDLRFGMAMGSIHVSTPARRDRLWLLNALAVALLTLLGAAGEALGYDRLLKSNTTKRRTHSLFRQGCMLYDLIPTMPEQRVLPLIERFAEMLTEVPVFADTFGAV